MVYTVGEVKMEKDKEWKTVTQVWVVPTAWWEGDAIHARRQEFDST